jgi:hypothetical protein
MDEDPLRIIAARDGVFLRREAIAAGYTDKMLARLRRAKVLHRVRHGAYCFHDVWTTLTPEERHVLLARAVRRTTPGKIAFSHTTALLLHGVAVWGADLTRVHATRLDGRAHRIERDVQHHVGRCEPDEVDTVTGLSVVRPARAVIEAGSILGLEPALVSADSALHLELCDPDELSRHASTMEHWPGSRIIHAMLSMADGRSASVGESRSRYLFARHGIPGPDLQFKVYDPHGNLIAITDFAWHERKVFGEFDGEVKYERYLRPGETPGDAVFREKKREDKIRAITGYGCGRLVWQDLHHQAATAARFRKLLGLG